MDKEIKYENIFTHVQIIMTRPDGTIFIEVKKSLFPYKKHHYRIDKGTYFRNSKKVWYQLFPELGSVKKAQMQMLLEEISIERRRYP